MWRSGLSAAGLAVVFSLVVASGCGDDGYGQSLVDRFGYEDQVGWDHEGVVQLALSDSCDDARASLRDTAIVGMLMDLERSRRAEIDAYRERGSIFDVFSFGGGEVDIAASGSSGGNLAAPQRGFTDTNVQTEGVDEADLVETDGELLYTLSAQDLVILDAWPAVELTELGRVSLPGTPQALYLYGDRVLVLSRTALDSGWRTSDQPPQGLTVATLVDVSDPVEPVVMKRWGFDGATSSTRRVGAKVYLVQTSPLSTARLATWVDISSDDDEDAITKRYIAAARDNIALLEGIDLNDYLPKSYEVNPVGVADASTQETLTDCGEVYRPGVYSGRGLVSVVTLDLDEPAERPYASSIVGGWGSVYASGGALYVASSDWDIGWWWGASSQRHYMTQIHKFSLEPTTGEAIYAASGEVPGHTFGQFALDEYRGQLRVATTAVGGEGDSSSFVTVLEERGGELAQVGQVGGIGPGEDIYAVRFIGERGYVVTFRQIDPLHVIDLSDPSRPRVAGELEMPGYSTYLHPMGEGYLLAVGRQGDEWGQIQGLQLSIFDVSDPSAPRRVHQISRNDGWGSWSEAESDHHAFTYYAERGLLAIPVGNWSESGESVGLSLFRVDPRDGIEPLGTIRHDDLIPPAGSCAREAASIRRGVFIDDIVYSISAAGIKAYATDDFGAGALAQINLHREGNDYCRADEFIGERW